MITPALGHVLWGIASSSWFYYAMLLVFLLAVTSTAAFVRSPSGASLRGMRNQPRRMKAPGHEVWLIRFLAFLVSGLLFVYDNRFISRQIVALQTSAEMLLIVISGGTATLVGPIAGAASWSS